MAFQDTGNENLRVHENTRLLIHITTRVNSERSETALTRWLSIFSGHNDKKEQYHDLYTGTASRI